MAFDGFLKLDGIDGESQDAKHKGEIDIQNFSWGVSQTGTFNQGGGGGAGKANFHDFSFTMKHQKSSPSLMMACATGQHIKSAIVTVRKAGKDQQEFLKFTFTDLLVSSYHTAGSSGGDETPNDAISMNFAKIEHEYKEQKADGSLGGSVKKFVDQQKNTWG